MFRYIGIPLLAGGLTTILLAGGYWFWHFIGPVVETGATAGEFFPDRSRVTAVTVELAASEDQPAIAPFDIPEEYLRTVVNKVCSAKQVRTRDSRGLSEVLAYDYNDDLLVVGSIRFYGWGDLIVDWGENMPRGYFAVYRSRDNPGLSFLASRNLWFRFEPDLEDVIRQAHADYAKSLASGP